jgi:hypothetical protein
VTLGSSLDNRRNIASKVRELYAERSAGTHGGKVMADSAIEATAIAMCRAMVFRLIDLYPKKVRTEGDIIEFVDRLRYS